MTTSRNSVLRPEPGAARPRRTPGMQARRSAESSRLTPGRGPTAAGQVRLCHRQDAHSSASLAAGHGARPPGITVNTVAPGFVPVERHADVASEITSAYPRHGPRRPPGHTRRHRPRGELLRLRGRSLRHRPTPRRRRRPRSWLITNALDDVPKPSRRQRRCSWIAWRSPRQESEPHDDRSVKLPQPPRCRARARLSRRDRGSR